MVAKERKSNRLKDFNYATSHYYFVTICVKNREKMFLEKLLIKKWR